MEQVFPASPCNKVCILDTRNCCTGCGRTIEEIAGWARMSAAEQWAVIARLALRREDAATRRSR